MTSDATPFDPRWDGAFIPDDHWHFLRRLHERYAVVLAPGEFSAVLAAIKAGKSVYYRKADTTVHWIDPPGSVCRIFVATKRGRIITVLAPGHAKGERARLIRAKRGAH